MGSGSAFASQAKPTVMVRVGEPGSEGIVEITDILFATQGPGIAQHLIHDSSFDNCYWF